MEGEAAAEAAKAALAVCLYICLSVRRVGLELRIQEAERI